MGKWADYLVSAVRYSKESNGKIISYLKVHQDLYKSVGEGTTWTRDEVIYALKSGKTFSTIFRNETGLWEKGSLIKMNNDGDNLIITDSMFSKQDHLAGVKSL